VALQEEGAAVADVDALGEVACATGGRRPFPPELPSVELNRLYESAQTSLLALEPGTPQTFATGDAHYIQWQSPDLVIAATNVINQRAARAPSAPG
jgi:hypothetical protein